MAGGEQTSGVSIPQHVVFRHFVAETVMLNLQTGQYHGLNPTAGQMLETLVKRGDPEAVVAELASEYDVEADVVRRDLGELVEELRTRGLIELASPDAS